MTFRVLHRALHPLQRAAVLVSCEAEVLRIAGERTRLRDFFSAAQRRFFYKSKLFNAENSRFLNVFGSVFHEKSPLRGNRRAPTSSPSPKISRFFQSKSHVFPKKSTGIFCPRVMQDPESNLGALIFFCIKNTLLSRVRNAVTTHLNARNRLSTFQRHDLASKIMQIDQEVIENHHFCPQTL